MSYALNSFFKSCAFCSRFSFFLRVIEILCSRNLLCQSFVYRFV